MSAEVAFLGRVVFRVNEDRIVRTRGHTRFAADANRLVEIDNTVSAFEHCCRRASRYAGRMSTLVAPRNLMRTPRLRECSDFYVLNVGAGHRQWNKILGFTRSCAGMAPNTTRMVNDLGPLNGSLLDHQELPFWYQVTVLIDV